MTVCAALALTALAAAGCGDEATPKAASMAITVTEPSAHRFHYTAPASVPAGLVRMKLTNKGKEEHKAQLWKILDGHSVEAALAARRPLPRWLISAGGVAVTEPGETASATQNLSPGRYYIADSGGDRGRVAPFRVVGDASDAKLPDTGASIVYRDYNFTAAGLKRGTHSIALDNQGFEPHHAVVAPVKAGSSVRELREFLRGRGTIPVGEIADLDNAAETAVIEEGQRQVVQLRLRPGKYALLCFVPDRRGGPAHVVKGMVDEVTVR